MIQDNLDNGTVKISSNTQKSPGDQKRIAVTPISVKNLQLKLVQKIMNSKIINVDENFLLSLILITFYCNSLVSINERKHIINRKYEIVSLV